MEDNYEQTEQAEQEDLTAQIRKNQHFESYILEGQYKGQQNEKYIKLFHDYVVERCFKFEGEWEEAFTNDLVVNGCGNALNINIGWVYAWDKFVIWYKRKVLLKDLWQ